jgi:uncharacterized protein YdeI (YjbR/CyaY-like superfamily)
MPFSYQRSAISFHRAAGLGRSSRVRPSLGSRNLKVAAKTLKTVDARTAMQWRRWLANHHNSESEVWLVFHKRHTGRQSMTYEDAVNEALCFGWVDSLIKRLDDERYARKFTPRKPRSVWSAANRRRYNRLKKSGRLTVAGLERAPTDRTPGPLRELPTSVPRYMREAFRSRPAAWRTFEALPTSERRRYVAWIDFAKREETRTRRLREAVRLLASGRKLGLK